MNLIEIFSILLIHWFADFVLQTDKQAKGKSKNWNDLLQHTIIYSVIWFIPIGILHTLYGNDNFVGNVMLWFVFITFICHTTTDYFTSRLNSKLIPQREYLISHSHLSNYFIFKNESWHKFFISVGFDQVLHYIQLFLTYWFIFK